MWPRRLRHELRKNGIDRCRVDVGGSSTGSRAGAGRQLLSFAGGRALCTADAPRGVVLGTGVMKLI